MCCVSTCASEVPKRNCESGPAAVSRPPSTKLLASTCQKKIQ
ncbi:MAG: hypothetical protein ACFFG0_36830 [Candidatus Thorarchaeota archaeon]